MPVCPRKYGVFGGFSHTGETKSMNARRAPNEHVWGPDSLAIERWRLIVLRNNALSILCQRLGLGQKL